MGYKIKEYRIKKGISQELLSKKSGVSRSIISGLETGRINTTTTSTLKKIAKALECSISDIFFTDEV